MPFIDLNTNNSVNSSVPQQASDTSSQPAVTNDNVTASNPTPSASSLDFNRLAAEGALPVLPPTVNSAESAELQPTPSVSTLDLSADAPTMGNDVRQVQGASFDEPETAIQQPADTNSEFVDATPVTDMPTGAIDPVMEVVPVSPESATSNVDDNDDLSSVLETLKASRAYLAQHKPTNTQVAETQPVMETAQPEPVLPLPENTQQAQAVEIENATNVTDSTNSETLDVEPEFKLGVENTPVTTASSVVEAPAVAEPQVVKESAPATNTVDAVPIAAESSMPIAEETVQPEVTLVQPVVEQPQAIETQETVTTTSSDVLPTLPDRVVPSSEVEPVNGNNLQSRTYSLGELLTEAVTIGASDLHLTAGYRALARLDGKLTELRSQILTHEDILTMLSDVVAPHVHVDLQHDLDIDISHQIENPQARFRVNIFYQQGTIGAVFRVIPEHIRTVEELRLPPLIKEFTTLPQGLVLVTGPTGSGKTTTLAALVNQINSTEAKHIITIEDPIEYVYPKDAGLVDQRAVYIDTPDWHTALRAVLRQDPNVVLIGEMRDVETMEAALTIAETGHLVFSTLHTNSAAQTIDRIIDAFPEEKQGQVRTQLAGVLMAVISQRLIPVSGGGRRAATEIMVVTPAIKNAIREQKVYQIDNIIQTSAELGMHTLEKSLVGLVREGVISPEVAQNYANRPEDVLTYLSKN